MILYAYRFSYNFYGLISVSASVDVKMSSSAQILVKKTRISATCRAMPFAEFEFYGNFHIHTLMPNIHILSIFSLFRGETAQG